jgi:protein involved in polysaccharide export with SLBB domain
MVRFVQIGQAAAVALALVGHGQGGVVRPRPQASAANPPRLTPVSPLVLSQRYRLHVGDTLEIKVHGRAELTQEVTIAPDGFIDFPYVKDIQAKDRTILELKTSLEKGLKRQIVDPIVLVRITKRMMGTVSIIGPVKESGQKELADDMRVMNLIGISGGLLVERPEFVTIKLIRKGGLTIAIDPVQLFSAPDSVANPSLEDGDVVSIQKLDEAQITVQVFGEVVKAGKYTLPKDGSVNSVLADAGGATARAALGKAVIRRATGQVTLIDLNSAEATARRSNALEGGDTLYVPQLKQVMVQGEIGKSGAVDLPENGVVTVLDAIQTAGGTTDKSDLDGVTLTRIAANGVPATRKIDLKKILDNRRTTGKRAIEAAEENVVLQPFDVIRIAAKKSRGGGVKFTDLLSAVSVYAVFKR